MNVLLLAWVTSLLLAVEQHLNVRKKQNTSGISESYFSSMFMIPNNDTLAAPSVCNTDLAKMQQHKVRSQPDTHSFSEGLDKHSIELEIALKKYQPSIML